MTRFLPGENERDTAPRTAGYLQTAHHNRNLTRRTIRHREMHLEPRYLAVCDTSERAVDLYRLAHPQAQLCRNKTIPQPDAMIIENCARWLPLSKETADAP